MVGVKDCMGTVLPYVETLYAMLIEVGDGQCGCGREEQDSMWVDGQQYNHRACICVYMMCGYGCGEQPQLGTWDAKRYKQIGKDGWKGDSRRTD